MTKGLPLLLLSKHWQARSPDLPGACSHSHHTTMNERMDDDFANLVLLLALFAFLVYVFIHI